MNLIAYYSRAGENYLSGSLKVIKKGNTEVIAEAIKGAVGGEMFKIEQKTPYSEKYNECIDEAIKDQRANARPKVIGLPDNIDKYDVVYLGYPNYWGTMPMAVFTFLESFDFSGKTIIPFCTHEGSGIGSSEKDIRRLCPSAKVEDGSAIFGSKALSSVGEIGKFLKIK